jgi:hypothetical protein
MIRSIHLVEKLTAFNQILLPYCLIYLGVALLQTLAYKWNCGVDPWLIPRSTIVYGSKGCIYEQCWKASWVVKVVYGDE